MTAPTTFHLLDPRRPPQCFECEGTGEVEEWYARGNAIDFEQGPATRQAECDFCRGLGFIDSPECRECNQPARVEMRDDEQQFTCLACLHHFIPDGCEVPAEIMALMPAEPSDEALAEMARELR